MGIEPMTSFLPRMRSTPELRGHTTCLAINDNCGPGRTRTCEGWRQRIYSPPPLPLGTLTHFWKLEFQADDGTWTHNLRFTRASLCQLSYVGEVCRYLLLKKKRLFPITDLTVMASGRDVKLSAGLLQVRSIYIWFFKVNTDLCLLVTLNLKDIFD